MVWWEEIQSTTITTTSLVLYLENKHPAETLEALETKLSASQCMSVYIPM